MISRPCLEIGNSLAPLESTSRYFKCRLGKFQPAAYVVRPLPSFVLVGYSPWGGVEENDGVSPSIAFILELYMVMGQNETTRSFHTSATRFGVTLFLTPHHTSYIRHVHAMVCPMFCYPWVRFLGAAKVGLSFAVVPFYLFFRGRFPY